MGTLLIILGIVAVAYHVVGVTVVKFAFDISPTQLDPCTAESIPPSIRNQVSDRENELKSLGFISMGWLKQHRESETSGDQINYARPFYHPQDEILGLLYLAISHLDEEESKTQVVDFESPFMDEHIAETSNAPDNIFPLSWFPWGTRIRFPQTTSVTQMYSIHRKLCTWVERKRNTKMTTHLKESKELREQEVGQIVYRQELKLYNELCHRGIMISKAPGDPFRLTWKGAIILTLRMMPPWKSLVNLMCGRYHRSFIKKIEAETSLSLSNPN